MGTAANNLSNTDCSNLDIVADHNSVAGHNSSQTDHIEMAAAILMPECLTSLHLLIFVNNDNYKKDANRFSDLPDTYPLATYCILDTKPILLTTLHYKHAWGYQSINLKHNYHCLT